ncbi:MAG: DUF4097 family beta strand repeat-containing protein [Anaerolineales bacterium]
MSRNTWIAIIAIAVIGVCALCVGAVLLAGMAYNVFNISTVNSGPFARPAPNVTASAEEQQTFEVVAPATLQLSNRFGRVDVRAAENLQGTLQVNMVKNGYGRTQQEAEAALNQLQVEASQTGSVVSLAVSGQDNRGDWQGGSVEFTIEVPVDTTVVIDSGAGSISLTGTQGKADLQTDFGEVRVTDFNGGLVVRTASGAVDVRRIGLLPTGEGDINLRSNFGAISLEDAVTGVLEVTSQSGQVGLQNVEASGSVRLQSQFGELRWNTGTAGPLTIDNGNGLIALSNLAVDGDLAATSNFGEISLTGVQAENYTLKSDAGRISADAVRGRVQVQSLQNGIELSGGEDATLDLLTRSGDIRYRGSLGAGPHQVETSFGNVTLSLPQDSAFDADLSTRFGSITTDFSVEASGSTSGNELQGSVNGGGPQLTVTSQNGNIRLDATP